MSAEIVLVRHGETEWSRTHRHTGRTDVPLTERGRQQADRIADALTHESFRLVLTSPLRRARETCERAGFGAVAVVSADLQEWNYGVYDGRTTAEIRVDIPSWSVWTHPISGGESVHEVGTRTGAVIERVLGADGPVAIFAHGHLLRILAARWLGLDAVEGRLFALDTGSLSTLGWERSTRVITRWNDRAT